MKKFRIPIFVAIAIALVAAGIASYLRAVPNKPTGLAAEIQKFDEKILPANVKRQDIREQLEKIQKQEREVCSRLSASMSGLSQEDRESLEADFRSGALSDANKKSPERVALFTQYREALTLKRETSALRERLARYELEISRALAERERLQRRLELSESLGYDPEAEDADPTAGNELLDALAAQTDAVSGAIPDPAKELMPEDLANDEAQAREELVNELKSVENSETETQEDVDAATDDNPELTEKLDELTKGKTRKFVTWRLGPYRKTVYYDEDSPARMLRFISLALGFGLTSIAVVGLGILAAIFFVVRSKPDSVQQEFQPGSPQFADPFADQVPQAKPSFWNTTEGRVVKVAIVTCFGGWVGGLLGAFLALVIGLFIWNFRGLARAVGVFGAVVMILLLLLGIFAVLTAIMTL